jgi:hypothetical protein
MERRGRLGNSRKLESGKNETLDSSFSNGQIHVQSPILLSYVPAVQLDRLFVISWTRV